MKKFLINHYLVLIVFVASLFVGFFYLFGEFKKEYLNTEAVNNFYEKMCQTEEMKLSEECQDYFNNGPYEAKKDVLYIFYYLLNFSAIDYLNYIIPFIIAMLTLKKASKIFNNSQAKLYLVREKYSTFIKNLLKSFFKYIFLFPIIFIILYFGCLWLGKGNFDVSYLINSGVTMFPYQYASLGPWFIVLFIYNLIINVIIYILLSLIALRIVNNYYISVIVSYILFLIVAITGEVFLTGIFLIVFNIDIRMYLNFINNFTFYGIPNYYLYTGIRIMVIVILSVITYILYRNKEKIVNYTEKKLEILK